MKQVKLDLKPVHVCGFIVIVLARACVGMVKNRIFVEENDTILRKEKLFRTLLAFVLDLDRVLW